MKIVPFTTDFDFTDLFPAPGIRIDSGTATLEDDQADGFFVSLISIEGGRTFDAKGADAYGAPNAFYSEIFMALARQIETAQPAMDHYHEKRNG